MAWAMTACCYPYGAITKGELGSEPADMEQMTEYAPAKIIISRDSFADDTAMANAYYILRDHGIELKLV